MLSEKQYQPTIDQYKEMFSFFGVKAENVCAGDSKYCMVIKVTNTKEDTR